MRLADLGTWPPISLLGMPFGSMAWRRFRPCVSALRPSVSVPAIACARPDHHRLAAAHVSGWSTAIPACSGSAWISEHMKLKAIYQGLCCWPVGIVISMLPWSMLGIGAPVFSTRTVVVT